MTHDLFVFTKSFQERLDEFSYILSSNFKAADVKREWSTFIEYLIEPAGWKAIWKVSRDVCTSLKINYPCTVVVTVEFINFKELSSSVGINEVEDRIACFPPMMTDIPLVELYPTVDQDSNIVLVKLLETAKTIDSLRFFYNHLWMPWDEVDYEESESWVDSHLEGRLQLQFALMDRVVPNMVAYEVHKLIVDGRNVLKEIEDIQEQLTDEIEFEIYSSKLLLLTELHNQMTYLQNQFRIFEKPELLKAYIQRAQNLEKTQLETENGESVAYLVLESSTSEQLGRLAKMTSEYKFIRIFKTLQETLLKAPVNASVFVSQGKHPVQELGNLENGGSIRGIESEVILAENPDNAKELNLLSGSFTLSNLAVHMNSVWNIIKVRSGAECVLQGVTLEGAVGTDAVDVFPGGKLVAYNCHFTNCRMAIACDTNSTVVLNQCTFTNNAIAIEIKEGCSFAMENCTISDSKEYGINIKAMGHGNQYSSDNINSVPGLKESGITFKNNVEDRHFDCSSPKPTDKSINECDVLSASR